MTNRNPNEQHVRERAYRLWQDAGSPDGGHEEFWRQASEELEVNQAYAPETQTEQNKASDDLVENAGGHYPPTSDSQNFA